MNALALSPNATLRPSGAVRWGPCAGSHALEARYPEDDGPEAREGTAAHFWATEALRGQVYPIATLAPNGHPIDAEMVEHGQSLIDDVTAELRLSGGNRIYYRIESKVYAFVTIHPENEGTPDVFLIDFDRCVIIVWDYKYGHRYVDAFENLQLINYFAAVVESAGLSTEDLSQWRVSLRVIQPRNYHRDGTVRRWDTTPATLAPYVARLREAAHAAKVPGAPVVTGSHCRDCRARHACGPFMRVAASIIDMSGESIPNELPPRAIGLELKRLAMAEERLKARRDALEEQALALIAAGQDVPFWAKGFVDSRERWKFPPEIVAGLGDIFGVSLRKNDVVTPAAARKLGVDANVIAEYAEKPRGAAKLIPADGTAARKAFGN